MPYKNCQFCESWKTFLKIPSIIHVESSFAIRKVYKVFVTKNRRRLMMTKRLTIRRHTWKFSYLYSLIWWVVFLYEFKSTWPNLIHKYSTQINLNTTYIEYRPRKCDNVKGFLLYIKYMFVDWPSFEESKFEGGFKK